MKFITYLACLLTTAASFAQKQSSFMVNFDFNKSDITANAAARLDSFIAVLPAKAAGVVIALYGHCDSVGNNEYNDALSLKRVEAVKYYLSTKGLEAAAINKKQGLGKRQPLNNNTSDYERSLNRRVELVITMPEEKVVEKPIEKVKEKTFTNIIEDTAVKVGAVFTLKNLNFIGGLHNLMPQSAPVLQELLDVMNRNPRLVISIEGHVCCIPDDGDGVDLALGTRNLSQMRAKTVYDYLLNNGIAANRISYKGFGHRFPLTPYPERSDEEMINNRRVEIKIISK